MEQPKTITNIYKFADLYDIFENIRGSLPIPEQLKQIANTKEKFIVRPEGLFILEAHNKLRKNSTVPPLLH